jgi:type III pantothenate kinase
MLLCDIGNTSYHFLDEEDEYKKSADSFNPLKIDEDVCFISVNHRVNDIIKDLSNWINLADYIDMSDYYETMGIDRVVACETLNNGVIIDAGSALTVDVVKDGKYLGGFIYPGRVAMQKSYENISSALAYSFNFDLPLDIMPKNSRDAISYGYLKTLYNEVMQHNLPVILTGGDAKLFAKVFKNAKVDEKLIFKGMKKIMKKANIC